MTKIIANIFFESVRAKNVQSLATYYTLFILVPNDGRKQVLQRFFEFQCMRQYDGFGNYSSRTDNGRKINQEGGPTSCSLSKHRTGGLFKITAIPIKKFQELGTYNSLRELIQTYNPNYLLILNFFNITK